MSDLSHKRNPQHRVRRHVLAAATAVALSALAGSAFAVEPAERVNLSTLGVAPAAEGYDRFIVKYREGTEAAGNVHMAERAVSRLNALAAGGKPVQLGVLRKLAVGGHLAERDATVLVDGHALFTPLHLTCAGLSPNVPFAEKGSE